MDKHTERRHYLNIPGMIHLTSYRPHTTMKKLKSFSRAKQLNEPVNLLNIWNRRSQSIVFNDSQ